MKEIKNIIIEIAGDVSLGIFASTMTVSNFDMSASDIDEEEEWRKKLKEFWSDFLGGEVEIIFEHEDGELNGLTGY